MKSAVLDGVPDLTGLVAVSVYDTNPVHFLSMCCKAIKWVQKTRQLCDPETQMVRDDHFLSFNVNDLYRYNMNSADLSDQLRNVYQVYQWMRKYK